MMLPALARRSIAGLALTLLPAVTAVTADARLAMHGRWYSSANMAR